MNDDTLFTKIIKREIPAYIIYEDSRTIAFLDINPVRAGHTLVVTKSQVDQYLDLSAQDYEALFLSVKNVAAHLKKTLRTDRVGISVHGVDVPHTHVHLIPFNARQSLHHDVNSPVFTDEALTKLAHELRFN